MGTVAETRQCAYPSPDVAMGIEQRARTSTCRQRGPIENLVRKQKVFNSREIEERDMPVFGNVLCVDIKKEHQDGMTEEESRVETSYTLKYSNGISNS